MVDNLKILLEINKDRQEVTVKLDINLNPQINILKFILNEGLEIRKVINDKGENIVFYEETNSKVLFIQSGKRVVLEIPNGTSSLTLEYMGKVSGWHNIITENYIALNFYAAWYPIFEDCDAAIDKEVIIRNIGDSTVVKGIKDNLDWRYYCNDFDCNIIAVKGWSIICVDNITPKLNLYFNKNEVGDVSFIAESFSEIIKYYNSLLDKESNIKDFDIVVTNTDNGGYCRERLIVLSNLPDNRVQVDGFLAHECGHIWSTGADANSWEDWLNETFAEVLSLSFLKNKYGFEAYMDRVNYIKEISEKFPKIKTENGERPEGVHFKGTYLMNRLSDKFGEDKVIDIVNIFLGLSHKTTENLLKEIYIKLGDNIGSFIEEGLIEE